MGRVFTPGQVQVEVLKELDRAIEAASERSKIWEMQLFNSTGKWKYTAYVIMEKQATWREFKELFNDALRDTPSTIRGVSYTSVPVDMTAVMVNNPLGFPIMVIGGD